MPPQPPKATVGKGDATLTPTLAGTWIPTGNDVARLQQQHQSAVVVLRAAAAQIVSLFQVLAEMMPGDDGTTIERFYGLQPGQGKQFRDAYARAANVLAAPNVQGLLSRFG